MSGHYFEEEVIADRVDLSLWRRLFRYARPYRRTVVLLAVTAVTTATADLAFPQITGRLVGAAARGVEPGELWGYGLAYLGAVLLLSGSIFCFIRLAGSIRANVSHDIRRDGFRNLQRLSFSFYDHRPVGWLMARMTSDCERLSMILAWGVLDLVWGTTMMCGVAVVLAFMDLRLALVVLSVVPVLALVSLRFQRRLLHSSRRVRRANSRLTGAYNEGIAAVATTKVFGREAESAREFGALTDDMYRSSVGNALQNALYMPLVMTLGSVATGLALAVGGMDVTSGRIMLGALVSFMLYTRFFFEPVQQMAHWFGELQMAQASAERILGLIDERPDIADSPAVAERLAAVAAEGGPGPGRAPDGLPDRVGRIELRGVGFRYPRGERVLEGLDLAVESGETVALVGATGGGKTTIVSLLCRFYEPTEGEVLLDGVDYRERSLAWLQSRLGIVLQQPHLFSGSVADNIRYGRLEATDAEVEEAARLVGADEFVRALEDGYATQVGEGGGRLSTGQKQLVSFARAILAQPEILVMDEATSSIDTETERRIQRGLEEVLRGRTSFVIAHRLSTIRSADRILVIEQGRIVEQGTHAELLARRGRYRALYVQQRIRERVRDEPEDAGGGLAPPALQPTS